MIFEAVAFFFLGLLGGWFFLLPIVEMILGRVAGVLAAVLTGVVISYMHTTGTLPRFPPPDADTCFDRQGSHRC